MTDDEFCTHERVFDARFRYGEGYELDVPPGSYRVYALKRDTGPLGYYTDMVTCGLGPECTNHNILVVEVISGQTATGIDPVDFYGDWLSTPTPP